MFFFSAINSIVIIKSDGFSLYSGITDYITEYFKSHFTEKIWLRNYSQRKSVNK
jgi:hypothetical protein